MSVTGKLRYQYVIRVNIEATDDAAGREAARAVPVPAPTALVQHGVVSVSTKLQRVYPDRAPVRVKW